MASKIPVNLTHPHSLFYHSLPWMCGWEITRGAGGVSEVRKTEWEHGGGHFRPPPSSSHLPPPLFLSIRSHPSEPLVINLRVAVLSRQHPCCALSHFLLSVSWWLWKKDRGVWVLLDGDTSLLPPPRELPQEYPSVSLSPLASLGRSVQDKGWQQMKINS